MILRNQVYAVIWKQQLRENALTDKIDFTFETVLSTDRNLKLLKRAKENGYFIRGIYVLTASSEINIARVKVREASGGHGVPEDKIRSRYEKALELIPQLVQICDILHVYDNSEKPFRIFKKRKDVYYRWENNFWNSDAIERLTGINTYSEYKK